MSNNFFSLEKKHNFISSVENKITVCRYTFLHILVEKSMSRKNIVDSNGYPGYPNPIPYKEISI